MIGADIIMSQKPYLIRAMYEWMLDQSFSPRLIISPLVSGVDLPKHLMGQNQVTLDISQEAIVGLEIGNNNIHFQAYFEQTPHEVKLSMNAIAAIIAKEKEVGYVFDIEDYIPHRKADEPKIGSLDASSKEASSNKTKATVKKTPKPKKFLFFWSNENKKNKGGKPLASQKSKNKKRKTKSSSPFFSLKHSTK